jgi:hypothetical protein
MFARAAEGDIQVGGVYSARGNAITVWSAPWSSPELRRRSEPVGRIHVAWEDPLPAFCRITLVEAEHPQGLALVQEHLARLLGEHEELPGLHGRGMP